MIQNFLICLYTLLDIEHFNCVMKFSDKKGHDLTRKAEPELLTITSLSMT